MLSLEGPEEVQDVGDIQSDEEGYPGTTSIEDEEDEVFEDEDEEGIE